MARYKIFAALHDDTDKGWIWASAGMRSSSRTTMLVTRQVNGKRHNVYCEYREIDGNFVLLYDRTEATKCMHFSNHAAARRARLADVDLNKLGKVAVVNEWYRDKLGRFDTDARGGDGEELSFNKPWVEWWADLRAACQHPEPGVRVATRIAVLGTWFGVTALLPTVAETEPLRRFLIGHGIQYPALVAFLSWLILGGPLSYFASRKG